MSGSLLGFTNNHRRQSLNASWQRYGEDSLVPVVLERVHGDDLSETIAKAGFFYAEV